MKREGILLGYTHRGQRSRFSKEERAAKDYCLAHSFFDSKKNELIYLEHEEEVVAAVNKEFDKELVIPEFIPETPQGLVLQDNYGNGAFQ